jgi:hypothetical protein
MSEGRGRRGSRGAWRRAPTPPRFYDEIAQGLGTVFSDRPDIESGQMMGLPALYTRGRLFACAYGRGFGLKLPGFRVHDLLAAADTAPFEPDGREPLREWLQVLPPHGRLRARDLELLEESAAYVAGVTTLARRPLPRASAAAARSPRSAPAPRGPQPRNGARSRR